MAFSYFMGENSFVNPDENIVLTAVTGQFRPTEGTAINLFPFKQHKLAKAKEALLDL